MIKIYHSNQLLPPDPSDPSTIIEDLGTAHSVKESRCMLDSFLLKNNLSVPYYRTLWDKENKKVGIDYGSHSAFLTLIFETELGVEEFVNYDRK